MKVEIKRIRKTCEACPAQWEGETADGRAIYIYFRWGTLLVGLGKDIEAAVESVMFGDRDGPFFRWDGGGVYDGTMTQERLEELTSDVLVFPPSEVSV